MSIPHIRILATGGTIAGSAGSALQRAYTAGELAIATLVEDAKALGLQARLDGIDIAMIGSQDIGWPQWQALHDHLAEAIADDDVDGVIITHGTDTAEETAFLLDLTLPAGKPVVIVGAMRPADAVGTDGMRNFANAARVASDSGAWNRGVLVVMGDAVYAPSDVRKATLSSVDAFRGFPRGPLGLVSPAMLDWFGPADRSGAAARFAWPESLPRVAILYGFAGMDVASVEAELAAGAKGLVLAGVGEGNAPRPVLDRLAQAVRDGIPVVRASRVDEGWVEVDPEDIEDGFIASRSYNPQKSRILLQLLIASHRTDRESAQAEFDRR
jgi:L-asparaginase